MTELDQLDFFTDQTLVADPYPYMEAMREGCPVRREPHKNVLVVTGYDEAVAVFGDADTFSSCTAVTGPFPGFPVPIEGAADDVTDIIEQYREQLPFSDQVTVMDPPKHTEHRALLMGLITPKRLKENEDFMWPLADKFLDDFIDNGKCEFLEEYAKPFSMLVIADLLGVPEEDHEEFRQMLAPRPGNTVGSLQGDVMEHNPLQWLEDKFCAYLEDRRANPRDDILTALATAKYPEGDTPEIIDVVKSATFLFAAGQETTTKLLSASMRVLAEHPEVVERLRSDRTRIPAFVEEMLRMESPVKSAFRLAKKDTALAGVDIPAGTILMINPGAINRDPRHFDDPHTFDLDRPNVREHLAFSRGAHSCPGGPLARVEGRVSLERILDRMTDIKLDEEFHGPAEARSFSYEPTFILRGLTEIHITFSKLAPAVDR